MTDTSPKTRPTAATVEDFLAAIPDTGRREECRTLRALIERVTGAPAVMWGPSMVGFGRYHYSYQSGREGDWFLAGFSPRKQALTVYLMAGFEDRPELMTRLGKYSTGKSCLYLKRLSDIDLDVLEALLVASVESLRRRYG